MGSQLPLDLQLAIACLAFLVAMMMWNFAIGNRAHSGKFPMIYTITKSLLVPMIGFIWWKISPDRHPYIVIYMVLSWIGDVFLMSQKIPICIIGGFCFGFSHVALMFYFSIKWPEVPYYAYFLMIPPLICHFGCIIPKLKFDRTVDYLTVLYVTLLEMGDVTAVARISQFNFTDPTFLMVWIGYLFFTISDFFLIRNTLEIDKVPRRIEIMLTYCIAQFLIITGTAFSKGHITINS